MIRNAAIVVLAGVIVALAVMLNNAHKREAMYKTDENVVSYCMDKPNFMACTDRVFEAISISKGE